MDKPWRQEWYATGSDGTVYRTVYKLTEHGPGMVAEGVFEAEANLISAAPELYRALDSILIDVVECENVDEDMIKFALAALKKARGE